jgi:hypothetical protein
MVDYKSKSYLLRLAVVTRSDLLPRRTTTLKVPEGLRQLKRFDNNALFLFVESELGVAGQGEVLPQWVSVEAVVGHDAPQIGVTDEEDTEHVVNLTLVPVGTVVEACDGGYGRGLVGVGLDANARVVTDGEHVVDDLEALVAGRVVDGGDVADLCEFGGGVVFEEGEDGDDAVGRNVDLEGGIVSMYEGVGGSMAGARVRSVHPSRQRTCNTCELMLAGAALVGRPCLLLDVFGQT